MLPPKIRQAYSAFYDEVRNLDSLDLKTTIIAGLAASMALGCDP